MKRYTIILKEPLMRPRFIDIEADSIGDIGTKDIPDFYQGQQFSLYGVVDYDAGRTVPVVGTPEGGIMEVPDGDFGELTPAEYFEEQSA